MTHNQHITTSNTIDVEHVTLDKRKHHTVFTLDTVQHVVMQTTYPKSKPAKRNTIAYRIFPGVK